MVGKVSKYRAVKTTIDGITFDSKSEAKRYVKLKKMEKEGLIKNLELQPEYLIQPAFKKNGKSYRKISYRADFKYFDIKENKWVVEDVKGMETPEFKLKHKLFEYKFEDLELSVVK